MTIFLLICILILVLLAVIGAFSPILPSVPLSWLGALCLYLMPDTTFTGKAFIIFSAISIAIFCLDYVLPLFTTKVFGGTKQGVRGATIGMILACIVPFTPLVIVFGGIWAIILFPFLGAFIAEMSVEGTSVGFALKSALGSFVGFLVSVGLKIALAISVLWLTFANVSF